MGKEFVCKIDGQSFLNREEAIKYLSSHYLKIIKKISETKDVQRFLEENFPQFIIEISKDASILDSLRIQTASSFLNQTDTIYCKLTGITIKGEIGFAISSSYQGEFSEELKVFNSLDEANTHLKRLLNGMENYAKEFLDFAKKYEPNIIDVFVHRIELYNYEYEHKLDIEYYAVFKDGAKKSFTTASIDLCELENEEVMNVTFQKHLKWLAGSYLMSVEGEVKYVDPYQYYLPSYYTVDGVEINHLAK